MGRRAYKSKEITNEEFDAWVAATKRVEAVQEMADEEGGPILSLVPVPLPERNFVDPTDVLPPAEQPEGEPPIVA